MKLNSIRARFILVISVLTAVILALQLYFINQTQKDVLGELNRFSRSLNRVTDELFIKQMGKRPSAVQIQSFSFIRDSLSAMKRGNVQPDSIKPGKLRLAWLPDTLKKSLRILDIKLNKIKSNRRKIDSIRIIADSLRARLMLTRQPVAKDDQENETIEFIVPAISGPTSHLMRFSYSTATMQDALTDIRNRNILISVLLLLAAIGVISLMARRFSAPIKHLQSSFEKVVEGDFSIHVESRGGDEIAKLAGAFNRMVEELRKNREKEASLRQKERLASLGQLAAGVAHEIRNPLNAIGLTIHHLEDRFMAEDDASSRQYVRIIQDEIKRLDKTVGNFLGYLREEKLNRRPVDMNGYIHDILRLYRREFEKQNIQVIFEPAGTCLFNIDGSRFKTVVINILINALQAMPDGGRLKIGLECKRKVLWIEDNGSGIPPGIEEHIFDLYYTTKSSGTGLGLPTAYKIVKAHGGDISILSNKEQGTRVTITIGKDEDSGH